MNPKQFLQMGGTVLLILGIVGYILPDVGGDLLWFDGTENIAHVVLGIVALALSALPLGPLAKWIVAAVGLGALYFGVAGFLIAGQVAPNWYGIVNLEIGDNVVHLVIGVWALYAAFNKNA